VCVCVSVYVLCSYLLVMMELVGVYFFFLLQSFGTTSFPLVHFSIRIPNIFYLNMEFPFFRYFSLYFFFSSSLV